MGSRLRGSKRRVREQEGGGPSPQSSPRMGEEVRGERPHPNLHLSRGRDKRRPPGPARFFVSGPPQNDMWAEGKREEDPIPPRRRGFLLSQE